GRARGRRTRHGAAGPPSRRPLPFPRPHEPSRRRGLPTRRPAGPGRSGRPLHNGRGRHRPRWTDGAIRPLRSGRMRLHRRSRRKPARFELDARVSRLRAARRARRRGIGPPARARPAAAADRLAAGHCRAARRNVARCRISSRRLRAGAAGPVTSSGGAAHRTQRARAQREPWWPLPGRFPARGSEAERLAHSPTARPRGRLRGMELTTVDVRAWLEEDLGAGDLTSDAVVPEDATAQATTLLKERGVVCGLELARAVFAELDPDLSFEAFATDGTETAGEIAKLDGNARALLGGETLALNLVGRLSGIAPLTRRYGDAVAGTGATILDTRKTTPGFRRAEKYAVQCGGGTNHR